jgi:hypothetical protein
MRFIFFVCLGLPSSALAVPTQLGHQGRVLDADGLPAEGLHSLEFRMYDADVDGTMVWSEIHDVDLINGYYSLVLGADELDNPLDDDLLRDHSLHLELTVDEDDPLSPRQALNAVPYARLSDSATNVVGGVVDASEIRVGGLTVVDGAGDWVGSTPSMDWSDLTGIPPELADAEDADTHLSEEEVDAFCSDNGYAIAADLAAIASSGSYEDLAGVPAPVGLSVARFNEPGTFSVPDGITSLTVYVTGGGGGGSNGESTALDLGSHSHAVDAHSHNGTGHTHDSGTHTHSATAGSSTSWDPCATTRECGCHGGTECVGGYVTSGGGTTTTGAATGISGDSSVSTVAVGLTTEGAESASVTVPHNGGDGGSGGGMSALLTVSPGSECTISIGGGGDVGNPGSVTTITCDGGSVECNGGSAGGDNGSFGRDGGCTVTGGGALSEYKASYLAPGGGGAGGLVAGATAGATGAVTIRY